MNLALEWMLGILSAGLLLGFLRLVRGPSLGDRVMALDFLAILGVSLLALLALMYEQPEFLDVAILLGLVGFISSVAFARSMEASRAPSNREGRNTRPSTKDEAQEPSGGGSASRREAP